MKIALLGTRGIPANYGGFETFAEELSVRLAARGHVVTVYCRSHYAQASEAVYRGVRRVVLPTVRRKYLDTPIHTCLSCLHLLMRRQDAVLLCNSANAVFAYWPRLVGTPTVLNVDGLERKRRKWGVVGRAWYQLAERLATLCPDIVVSDSRVIQRYYSARHGLETPYIAYGASCGTERSTDTLDELGLRRGEYFLYVSRFEPENNARLVVEEFERCGAKQRLVMVGDAPYAAGYIARVKASKDPRILFPGAIYGKGYRELQSHCFAYIHAAEVGGTHPALVEAMGRGCAVLYLDTPENHEVAGRVGLSFSVRRGSLRARLEELAAAAPGTLLELRQAAMREAAAHYDWNVVTDRYESLLRALVTRS